MSSFPQLLLFLLLTCSTGLLSAKASQEPLPASQRFQEACQNPSNFPNLARFIQKLRESIDQTGHAHDDSCETLHSRFIDADSLHFNFDDSPLEEVDFSLLSEATRIRYLDLIGVRTQDLRTLPRLGSLVSLVISGSKALGQQPPAVLDFIPEEPAYQHLQLSDLQIEDLSPLQAVKAVEYLILSGNRITDEQLQFLQGTSVWHLDLSKNPITELNSIPNNPWLKSLNLRETSLSRIGSLSNYPALFELDLQDTPFSESPERVKRIWRSTKVEILNDWSPFLEVCRNLKLHPDSHELVRALHWYDIDNDQIDIKDRVALPEPEGCIQDARRLHEYDLLVLQLQRFDRSPMDLAPLAGFKNLKHLTLGNHMGVDLAPLAGLRGLQSLNLDRGSQEDLDYENYPQILSGITPLASLTKLRTLSLKRCGVSDLSPLNGMKNLTSLDLSQNQIPSAQLGNLKSLQKLKTLNLSANPISTLENLPQFSGLQEFKARGCQLNRADELSNHPRLMDVDLANNQLESVQALSHATKMQTLDIGDNLIQDLSPLAGMDALQSLNANGNRIHSLESLKNLKSLQSLDVSFNQFDSAAALAGLSELRNINLSGNAIRDVRPLALLQSLETLSLNRCRIRDVAALANLRNLTQLELAGNAISSIESLTKFENLASLDLSNNLIRNLDPIVSLTRISSLQLGRNQISNLPQDFARLSGLFTLDLSDNRIEDASPLLGIENLRNFDLSRNRLSDFPEFGAQHWFESISVEGNRISDTSPFAQLTVSHLNLANNQISNLLPLQGIFSDIILKSIRVDMTTSIYEVNLHGNPIRDFSPLIENLPRKWGYQKDRKGDDSERYLNSDYMRRFTRVTISQGTLSDEDVRTLRARSPFDFLTVLP